MHPNKLSVKRFPHITGAPQCKGNKQERWHCQKYTLSVREGGLKGEVRKIASIFVGDTMIVNYHPMRRSSTPAPPSLFEQIHLAPDCVVHKIHACRLTLSSSFY